MEYMIASENDNRFTWFISNFYGRYHSSHYEAKYPHARPTESPLFGSCQLLATQAPRLCSIPAEPLSVQATKKRTCCVRDERGRRYLCHLLAVVTNSNNVTTIINGVNVFRCGMECYIYLFIESLVYDIKSKLGGLACGGGSGFFLILLNDTSIFCIILDSSSNKKYIIYLKQCSIFYNNEEIG
ncbi:uncharacterized protein LOC143152588 [Ptiloglossa arizonensis]|uniref:uncharacterized protein LOC143152588 n=1 Tax=Ptiloglossa arizonensis TaxID=3350558 RepID=UPI003F9FD781